MIFQNNCWNSGGNCICQAERIRDGRRYHDCRNLCSKGGRDNCRIQNRNSFLGGQCKYLGGVSRGQIILIHNSGFCDDGGVDTCRLCYDGDSGAIRDGGNDIGHSAISKNLSRCLSLFDRRFFPVFRGSTVGRHSNSDFLGLCLGDLLRHSCSNPLGNGFRQCNCLIERGRNSLRGLDDTGTLGEKVVVIKSVNEGE